MRFIVLAAAILAAACTPVSAGRTPVAASPHPYATATRSATSEAPVQPVVSAEPPLPSPTPARYTIQPGDTLSQIAERFRITLDALLIANPGINPTVLTVGESLLIPASPADRAGEATPTPVPLPVRQMACHPTANGAVWCFALVHNDTPDNIEDVTARITLLDSAGVTIGTRTSPLPLDILPSGASLPISALFGPPVPLDAQPQVQILTGIRLLPGDPRHLPAAIQNSVTEVAWSGRSAQIRGDVFLPETSISASAIWVVAVAYDQQGSVVGWRRWESTGDLAAGSNLPFAFMISSVAGRIDRVELVVQARP